MPCSLMYAYIIFELDEIGAILSSYMCFLLQNNEQSPCALLVCRLGLHVCESLIQQMSLFEHDSMYCISNSRKGEEKQIGTSSL